MRPHIICLMALLALSSFRLAAQTSAGSAIEPLQPLPEVKLDERKVALGQTLFHDKRMSADGKISCANCHIFSAGGSDPAPVSTGVNGNQGATNSMSIFNLAFQPVLNWDGRNNNLAIMVERLVANRGLIGGSWDAIVDLIGKDTALAAQFKAIYPDGVTKNNYTDATAAYVQSLTTPSRFDRYLRGDKKAISREEDQGYQDFKTAGCVGCHSGVAVGGTTMMRLGLAEDYFTAKRAKGLTVTPADQGRFVQTKSEQDMHVFKVPSLRNVALTAPYFHDASAKTLDEAVEAMFRFQLGRKTTPKERENIVKFLGSLTGERLPAHP